MSEVKQGVAWPKELIDAFDVAIQQPELVEGYTKVTALVTFLDAAARMAVWRCKGEPAHLEGGYFWPYTPIGHLTFNGMGGGITGLSLGGEHWGNALALLKRFIRAHAAEICETYRDDPLPYPHEI